MDLVHWLCVIVSCLCLVGSSIEFIRARREHKAWLKEMKTPRDYTFRDRDQGGDGDHEPCSSCDAYHTCQSEGAGYWFCHMCQQEVAPCRVTNDEIHDGCGHPVVWEREY